MMVDSVREYILEKKQRSPQNVVYVVKTLFYDV